MKFGFPHFHTYFEICVFVDNRVLLRGFSQGGRVVSLKKLRAPQAPLGTWGSCEGQGADARNGCDVGVGEIFPDIH